jgi:uracil-DNA glycosylase
VGELLTSFISIARCPNVQTCLESTARHPCRKIIASQGVGSYERFQAPEPWVGQIDLAPILFVASNPSIGDDEHAFGSARDEQIWESHHLAFGGGKRAYILNGTETTKPDGTPGHVVNYWRSIRARARELIPERPVKPGRDYAITEIVHCKSKSQVGVAEAYDECVDRHFETVMKVSGARVFVAVGSFAWRRFLGEGVTPPASPAVGVYGEQERALVFLPHPSSFIGPKSLAKRYSTPDLERLRQLVVAS